MTNEQRAALKKLYLAGWNDAMDNSNDVHAQAKAVHDAILALATPPASVEAREAEPLIDVLREVRRVLDAENENPFGAICDTIWRNGYETLFDYIDAALASQGAAGSGK